MGGSVIAQFLYNAYITNLTQTVTNYATQMLGLVAATVNGAIMLYVLFVGKQLMFGELPAGVGASKMVRAAIVAAIMTAANYQTYVATPITTTLPNFIAGAVPGQHGVTGAQAWDALLNKVDNFDAQIHSQAVGLAYIGDR